MLSQIYVCETCKVEAKDEKQLRHENWIKIKGGTYGGIVIFLEKPRKKGQGYTLSVGFRNRDYHFCSPGCLIKAVNGKESI